MTYNATNRKDIRRAEKSSVLVEKQCVDFIVAAMGTLQGRAWFYRLLSNCRIFNDPFTGNALIEAHSKGERNIGLRIYNDIVTHCPDHFVTMMREATIQEQVHERRADADRHDDYATVNDTSDDGNSVAEQSGSEDDGWNVEGSISPGWRDEVYGVKN